MKCKYSKYSDKLNNVGRNDLICNITKEPCPLVRFCDKVNKLINNDFYENCRYYIMENEKLKNGFYKVRFEKHGKLYVEVDNKVLTFDNTFKEVPKQIELVNVEDVYYIKGTEPKQEPKQQKYQSKKRDKTQLDDIEKELMS